jgi:hypothetical protein
LVFLKLQPYVQLSLAPHSNKKISFKFFGPFTVVQKVDNVAYRLQLPQHSSIHTVFHISQLKRAVGAKVLVSNTLPSNIDSFQVSEKILQKRLVAHGLHIVMQVLVKWSLWHESLATWEDFEAPKQRFPHAPAWGQAVANGGGNVTIAATDTEEVAPIGEAGSSRASHRLKRPNVKVSGPEWVV